MSQWMDELPKTCDFCGDPLEVTDIFYDFKSHSGVWGIGCEDCFRRYGNGLGVGKGQRYRCKDGIKIGG